MSQLLTIICTSFLSIMVATTAAAGTKDFDKKMSPVLKQYLKIQTALAADNMDGVKAAAKSMAKAANSVNPKSVTGDHAPHYKHVPMNIKKAAKKISSAKNIEDARKGFKDLSKPMAMWASMSKPSGVDVVYCSMAKASWLQKSGKTKNPYYGKKMLSCGEVVK